MSFGLEIFNEKSDLLNSQITTNIYLDNSWQTYYSSFCVHYAMRLTLEDSGRGLYATIIFIVIFPILKFACVPDIS